MRPTTSGLTVMATTGTGTTASVERLFDEHYERLVRSLSVAACDREVAADAVQEAFVQAHLRWDTVRDYDDPVGWIRRVALNRISNSRRRIGRGLAAVARLDRPGGREESGPVVDRLDLEQALRRLSSRQRQAVALFYLEGMTVEATAKAMGVSGGSVKTHLSRARERLLPLLEVS